MIAPQCFWKNYEHTPYLFCEERLCGYITEPANTWSNIGFLIVALLIFKSRDKEPRIRLYFFWSCFTLFVGSTLFHATSSSFGKFADVSAMFFLSVTILSLALERFFELTRKQSLLIFLSILTASLCFLFIAGFGSVLFGFQVLLSGWLEWKIVKKDRGIHWPRLKLAVVTLFVAFMIWLLDVYKILCIPGNHILTGHGVWHLMTALTIWVFFSAYQNQERLNLKSF